MTAKANKNVEKGVSVWRLNSEGYRWVSRSVSLGKLDV